MMKKLFGRLTSFWRGFVHNKWLCIHAHETGVDVWRCDGPLCTFIACDHETGLPQTDGCLMNNPHLPVVLLAEVAQEFFEPYKGARWLFFKSKIKKFFWSAQKESLETAPSKCDGTLSLMPSNTFFAKVCAQKLKTQGRLYTAYSFSALYMDFCRLYLAKTLLANAVLGVHVTTSHWWGVLWDKGHLLYARKVTRKAGEDVKRMNHDIKETALYAFKNFGERSVGKIYAWGEGSSEIGSSDINILEDFPTHRAFLQWASYRCTWIRLGGKLQLNGDVISWAEMFLRYVRTCPRRVFAHALSGLWALSMSFGAYVFYQDDCLEKRTFSYQKKYEDLCIKRRKFGISSKDFQELRSKVLSVGPLAMLRKIAPFLKGGLRLRYVSWRAEGESGPTLLIEIVYPQKPSPRIRSHFKRAISEMRTAFPKGRVEIVQGEMDVEEKPYGGGLSGSTVEETSFLVKLSW